MNRSTFLKIISALFLIIGSIVVYAYIMHHTRDDVFDNSCQIYQVLDHYRITYDIDKHGVDSTADTTPIPAQEVDKCIQNIAYFIAQNRPIAMLMVGFPFKSANEEKKVLGRLPDMAERKSLEYLQGMLNDIKKVYKPGANILIFCDGIPFAEFCGISMDAVINYEKALKALAADLPDISLYTSQDMISHYKLALAEAIIPFVDRYEPSDAQFKQTLKVVPETALKRIALELDYPEGRVLIKKHGLENIVVGLLAREMRLRTFLTTAFPSPDFFRLTVHLSPDVSKKFGVKLSPNSDVTPYHGTLVEEADGSWAIKYKKDIDVSKYIMQDKVVNGVDCWYLRRL